jgi:hypothetical protein
MAQNQTIQLRPIAKEHMAVRIRGLTPLVMHQWDEKVRKLIRDKHAGKKTRDRSVRNPEAECDAATYKLADGSPGLPLTAIKSAMLSAAHKDIGITKTLVSKSVFIKGDEGLMLRLETTGAKMREDVVRVGMGGTDLRYRPEFVDWAVLLRIEYDAEWITPEIIVNLLERAGFGIGVGENRPEKGGEWGRFEVDRTEGGAR